MLALALLCSAPQLAPAYKDVLVVDELGGGDFVTIQEAVDAAQGGEVILVRSGTGAYPGFEVVGKSLVITGEPPDLQAVITSGVRVAQLAAGQEVVLANLGIPGVLGQQPDALLIQGCAGSVRVERCDLTGANNLHEPVSCAGPDDGQGYHGARVQGSSNVAFSSCTLTGGRGLFQSDDLFPTESCGFWTAGGNGGHGLALSSSSVATYDCTITGGLGGYGGWGGLGGDGVHAEGAGVLVLSGGSTVGGKGGTGFDYLFGPGGNGGAGLRTSSTTYRLGGSFLGGAGGPSGLFDDGDPGPDIVGATTPWSGGARGMETLSPVSEGAALDVAFHGQPGDLVLFFVSISQSFGLFPAYQGVALVGTAKPLALGACDAGGTLQVSFPVPELGPGFESLVLAAQSVFVSTAPEVVVGPFRHAVLLDSAF